MAKFNVEISDEVAKKFRIKIVKLFGSLRGHIDECAEEAIKDWIEKNGGEG